MKYTQLVKAIDATSQHLLGRAVRVVNQSLVIRNWIIGACIGEFALAGLDNQLFVSRYLVALPTKEQLSRFLEAERARLEALIAQLKATAPGKWKRGACKRGSARKR